MAKVGKTYTIDLSVYQWLEQHAKEHNMKVSYLVNAVLNTAKRQSQTWKCSVCGTSNSNENPTCFVLTDGVFCKGVRA